MRNEANDPYRQLYHFTPPAGWMNDPNGLVYFRGWYHFFYQHNPQSAVSGDPVGWGHARSRDLVHWEHLPAAIEPDRPYDLGGCYSGSAVVDGDRLVLFYTGNVFPDVWETAGRKIQVQCAAVSTDGVTFVKDKRNPIISYPPQEGSADFRDPKVWRQGKEWRMLIGTGYKDKGKALLYRSEDLNEWTYAGVASESNGEQGIMWECPDWFALGDKEVLIVSPYGPFRDMVRKTISIVGRTDERTGRFVQDYWQDLDGGPDFFAGQTYVDERGRRILIAWMEMWDTPMPTAEWGWSGTMTLPRELGLSAEGRLTQRPIEELRQLRREHASVRSLVVKEGDSRLLPDLEGDALELMAEFDLASCTAGAFGIALRCSEDRSQQTRIVYEVNDGSLLVDRSRSGIGKNGVKRCLIGETGAGTLKLHVFLDRSSVEVFANDGIAAMSSRIYPDPSSLQVDLFAGGGSVTVRSLDAWRLASARQAHLR